MTQQDEQKQRVAQAAVDYFHADDVIGIGTGSTVNCLITELAKQNRLPSSAVSSSSSTTELLKGHGVEVISLNEVSSLDLYIDGADEVDPQGLLIKGGGGAMTQEKILASEAKRFIVMIDDQKQVKCLHARFPVPIEVLPLARSAVARRLVAWGANPVYRTGCTTDQGNCIVDVYDLPPTQTWATWEDQINTLPGVVENGIFAKRRPDLILVAQRNQVYTQQQGIDF